MELEHIHLCFGLFRDSLKCLEPVYSVRGSNAINVTMFKCRHKPTGCSEILSCGPRVLSTVPYH